MSWTSWAVTRVSDGEWWSRDVFVLFVLVAQQLKNVGSSACSRESALWLRLLRGSALQFALAFVFFMLFSSEWACVGTVLVACGRKLRKKGFRYVCTKGQALYASALWNPTCVRRKQNQCRGCTIGKEWHRNRSTQVLLCMFRCIK